MPLSYDALLVLSFGGPGKMADVTPFLQNVLQGKNMPPQRIKEVARHYALFDGISPISQQNRNLAKVLQAELARHGPNLPVYLGNRNWHPLLTDTLKQMTQDGIKRALVFVTSVFSSYSGCRQYLEDMQRARQAVGPDSPQLDKLRVFYNHPGFIESVSRCVEDALQKIPAQVCPAARIIFTAHSIPMTMAHTCQYQTQLNEACRLVCQRLNHHDWTLVYQSRSGPPTQPWLEPDICDYIEQLGKDHRVKDIVIVPIGFISDHMEVIYDLDTQAHDVAQKCNLNMVRAATVINDPHFITMIRQLIAERFSDSPTRLSMGELGPAPDTCAPDCCPGKT